MKLNGTQIKRIFIGAVAVTGAYIGIQTGGFSGGSGQAPAISYAMYEPTGEWLNWADRPTYTPNLVEPVFNIEDYGGDGTDQEPDTYAFRAAMAAQKLAGEGTVYLPEGQWIIMPDQEYNEDTQEQSFSISLHHSPLIIEGDGPDKTIINARAWGDQDPNDPILYRGYAFSTLYTPTPLDGITLRGFRCSGNAPPTNEGGEFTGIGSLNGWDTTHKFLAIFGTVENTITNITVEDCELDNWRGEIVYSGGGTELGNFFVKRCLIRGSNASMISMGGQVVVEDCEIYAGYNATECRVFGTQGLTVTGTRIRLNEGLPEGVEDIGKFGVVYLGGLDASLTVSDCVIQNTTDGGVFLSEGASNVTISDNLFEDTFGIKANWIDQYTDFPDEATWVNWNITGNTFRATVDDVELAVVTDSSPGTRTDWTFDGNIVESTGSNSFGSFLGIELPTSGFVFSNNEIEDAIPIAAPRDGLRPTWTTNTVTGTYALGTTFTDNCDAPAETPWSIHPTWPKVNVNFTCGTMMSRILQIDPTKLADYPTGFPIEIRRTGENPSIRGAEILPDAAWNTLTDGYMVFEGAVLNLVKNGSGKFDFVSFTPPTENIQTWGEFAGNRISETDIAFCGQQEVNLTPGVAHTFDTFSGVAIGDTVAINYNANTTIEHVPGVMEISTGLDFVAIGTGTLSATRDEDGILQITII